MTRREDWFTKLDKTMKSKVKFAYESTTLVERRVNILIQQKDGNHAYIFDVLYVPTIKNNLISLGQHLEKGYKMKMELSNLLVIDNKSRTILKAPLSKNRTFKVEIQTRKY